MVEWEEGTTKYANGAKRQAKIAFNDFEFRICHTMHKWKIIGFAATALIVIAIPLSEIGRASCRERV